MKLTVQRVYTLVETVEIPTECPKCETAFADQSMGYLALGFDPYAQECAPRGDSMAWGSMEHDGEDIVTGYACRECGHVLAGTDGAKPIDRAPGPQSDLDAIPMGREILRVIREDPCWLSAGNVCEVLGANVARSCELLEAAGWIEPASYAFGVPYYRAAVQVDTCPVCGEPCHATEGDELGRHPGCQGAH